MVGSAPGSVSSSRNVRILGTPAAAGVFLLGVRGAGAKG